MNTSTPPYLLSQRVINWLIRKCKENRVSLLSALFFAFLAHTFAFTNKLLNSDEVQCLFAKGSTTRSGRWGLDIISCILPDVSMPWIHGIITIVLLAISVCLLVRMLNLRSSWVQVLAAGFILTFPSLTGTFSYMFTSSSYGVSFLLATFSVWLLLRKSTWSWLGATVCMILSLSLYQGYVSLTAGVLVLILMRQLMDGTDPLTVLRRGIAYVVFLIVSMGLYYGLTLVIQHLSGIEMGNYATGSIDLKPSELIYKVQLAYVAFFDHFRGDSIGLIPTAFSRKIHIALLAFAAVLLLMQLIRMRRKPCSVLLFVVLVVLFPLAVNCIYLIILYWSIHTLVMYGFVSTYLLVLLLADEALAHPVKVSFADCVRRLSLDAAAILSAVIIMANIYIANEAYLTLHLRYENTYAFYSSLVADLRMSPDFTEGTRLAVIGEWDKPSFYDDNMKLALTITGISGVKPDCYGRAHFVKYYIGLDIPFATGEEESEIAASAEYAEMPVYPYYGSMRKFGDIMVVKLS